MFASDCKATVEVGDEQITIRKLSARQLDAAQERRGAAQVKALRDMGGDVVKAMRSDNIEDLAQKLEAMKSDPKAMRRQRYDAFDVQHVLKCGLVSWTHSRELNPTNIADLDEATSTLLHETILDLSLPPLDLVEREAAEAKD